MTPVVSSVPSGVTTVTPASASDCSGSFRMLTSATGFFAWSTASWYMKHSLPSGAQRTCQSPKVSLTISITSGCAGAPASGAAAPAPRSFGRGASAAGASAAGASRRRAEPPGAAGRLGRGGLGGRGGGFLGGEGSGQRQSEGGQDEAVSDRLHRLLASQVICRPGGLSLRGAAVNARDGRRGRDRAQVKRAPEGRPFPRFRDFPVGLGRTMGGRYDR